MHPASFAVNNGRAPHTGARHEEADGQEDRGRYIHSCTPSFGLGTTIALERIDIVVGHSHSGVPLSSTCRLHQLYSGLTLTLRENWSCHQPPAHRTPCTATSLDHWFKLTRDTVPAGGYMTSRSNRLLGPETRPCVQQKL